MKASPTKISELILEKISLDTKPIKLLDIIEEVITEYFIEVDAIEKSCIWEPSIRLKLLTIIREDEKRGMQPKIAFNSSSEYMIQGACFIEGSDSEDTKEQKKRRIRWKEYYEALRSLSPHDFELLCKKLLTVLGAKNVKLTQYSRDEGIDFYGNYLFRIC